MADRPPQKPGPAQRPDTCPDCGHAWDVHDDLGCTASIMPETATWAGQETWCDCERPHPKRGPESGPAA